MLEQPTPQVLSVGRSFSVSEYHRAAFYRRLAAAALLVVLSVFFGTVLAVFFQHPALIWGIAATAVLLPMVWFRPVLAVYLLVAAAAIFETFTLHFPDSLTDRVPIFMSFNSAGLPVTFPLTPVELLLVSTLLVVMLRRMATRVAPLELGSLFWALTLYSAMVLFGLVHGISTGGDLNSALWEMRAQAYLLPVYLLVFNLIRNRNQVRLIFLVFLTAVALKGLIGSWRYLVTLGSDLSLVTTLSNYNSLLSHEESFFFAIFLTFIFVMLMLRGDRRQLTFALLLSPPVLLAFLANQRRAGTLALVLGIVAAALLVYVLVQHRRNLLRALAVLGLALLPLYVLALGNSASLIAQPANSIMSVFEPEEKHLASNVYRTLELENLQHNIMQDPILGRGYGKPMLVVQELPDISQIFSLWEFIPHNTLLWLWMRAGFVGFVAFWFLIGRFILEACLAARSQRDPYLKGVSILAVAATVAWLSLAAVDMGLVDFRSTILMGVFFGLVSRLSAPDGLREPGQQK